eukprot:GHVU01171011.1.p2 GENE.GHVU01171011.1~~GHVU01171011.1.p2  ORF type:complete len:123 (-),score=0.62 GHVU01171011.1:499-867(-)
MHALHATVAYCTSPGALSSLPFHRRCHSMFQWLSPPGYWTRDVMRLRIEYLAFAFLYRENVCNTLEAQHRWSDRCTRPTAFGNELFAGVAPMPLPQQAAGGISAPRKSLTGIPRLVCAQVQL